tara:strand:+ start:1271 stop:2068 length:798 start_codon:yes stop_codon:yes gene_type:complete
MGESTIALGLGLGGGKTATISGRPGGGGALSNTLSAYLDGSNELISVGDISAINSASNVTISGWFNASSFPHSTFNSLWGGGGQGDPNHPTRFWLSCNNSSYFRIYLGSTVNNTFAYTLSTDTWYNVVLTVDGSAIKLYVNGSQVGTTYTNPHGTSLFAKAGDVFEIGSNPTYDTYEWDGYIDEFAVFNSTLSAANVTAIYNSGVPTDLPVNPVNWWRMGDGTGDTDDGGGAPASGDTIGTIVDQAGSNNGTGTNGPAFSSNVPS